MSRDTATTGGPIPAPVAAGDFLTAPETHPIFGAAVGRLLEQAWDALGRPEPVRGRRARRGHRRARRGPARSRFETPAPRCSGRSATGRSRSSSRGSRRSGRGSPRPALGPRSTPATPWRTASRPSARSSRTRCSTRCLSTGSIGRPGGIREQLVGLDAAGGFAWLEAEPDDARARRAPRRTRGRARGRPGHRGLPRASRLARGRRRRPRPRGRRPRRLRGGARVPAWPARRDGTLRGVRPARASAATRSATSGRQDLTATVDLAAVRAAAARAGLEPVGETTQAELLAATAGDLAASILRRPGATLEDALLLRSALARLLDPRGMGGYRVLVFGRGLPAGAELPACAGCRRPAGRSRERPAERAAIGRWAVGPTLRTGSQARDRC